MLFLLSTVSALAGVALTMPAPELSYRAPWLRDAARTLSGRQDASYTNR